MDSVKLDIVNLAGGGSSNTEYSPKTGQRYLITGFRYLINRKEVPVPVMDRVNLGDRGAG